MGSVGAKIVSVRGKWVFLEQEKVALEEIS
jgi:hypothetical protein